jgi:hypothetical protein
MIEGIIALATYGSFNSGGIIGNLFNQWEQAGLFDYVLPFLIIFALIFGILSKLKIFGDNSNSVNAILALAVGFLSLQSGFVTTFFKVVFPKFGVGLAIILVCIILLGLFIPNKSVTVLFIIAAVVLGGVLYYTSGELGWMDGNWLQTNIGEIGAIVLVIVAIGSIIAGTKTNPANDSPFARALLGKS